MATKDLVQQLKDEGRREGQCEARRENLVTIYRTRFGAVPRKLRAAIERTDDDVTLAGWIAIFVARSAAEISAAVAAKKV